MRIDRKYRAVKFGFLQEAHWFSYFFDKSMVLFDNIIQIFNLAYIDHSGKPSQN